MIRPEARAGLFIQAAIDVGGHSDVNLPKYSSRLIYGIIALLHTAIGGEQDVNTYSTIVA